MATLIANKLDQVSELVTIAANLDVSAWANYHHYSPLLESENPAEKTLRPLDLQRHYVGAEDDNVPARLNRAFFTKNNVEPLIIEGFNHRCCWLELWPSILSELSHK